MSDASDAVNRLANALSNAAVSVEEFTQAINRLGELMPGFTDDDITVVRRRFGSWWVARNMYRDSVPVAILRCWVHAWSADELRRIRGS